MSETQKDHEHTQKKKEKKYNEVKGTESERAG